MSVPELAASPNGKSFGAIGGQSLFSILASTFPSDDARIALTGPFRTASIGL
jgi:hypothetical protein